MFLLFQILNYTIFYNYNKSNSSLNIRTIIFGLVFYIILYNLINFNINHFLFILFDFVSIILIFKFYKSPSLISNNKYKNNNNHLETIFESSIEYSNESSIESSIESSNKLNNSYNKSSNNSF